MNNNYKMLRPWCTSISQFSFFFFKKTYYYNREIHVLNERFLQRFQINYRKTSRFELHFAGARVAKADFVNETTKLWPSMLLEFLIFFRFEHYACFHLIFVEHMLSHSSRPSAIHQSRRYQNFTIWHSRHNR